MAFDKYISGYFCKSNTNKIKGTTEFLLHILSELNISPSQVTVVGDSFKKDIQPALSLGIQAVWFSNIRDYEQDDNMRVICALNELCLQQVY